VQSRHRHACALAGGRYVVPAVQEFEKAPQRVKRWFASAATRRLRAILDAHAVGGAITTDELEQI
jgi:hypothetical protein